MLLYSFNVIGIYTNINRSYIYIFVNLMYYDNKTFKKNLKKRRQMWDTCNIHKPNKKT